jgi:hypothetical protein
MTRVARSAVIAAVTLALSGCLEIDWETTGQMWLGALCDGVSHCSYDADGDPYTLR